MELGSDTFDPKESTTNKKFLPAFFGAPTIPAGLSTLTSLPVWHEILGALQPGMETTLNRATSLECTSHLVEAS
eukprot:15340945-Ditylum_brightwellii.AAC.2